jgi:hypothetical protein
MASLDLENEAAGPPTKRQKISAEAPSIINTTQPVGTPKSGKDVKMDDRKTHLVVVDNGFQPEREAEVGILHFVNTSNPGFSGTLKQRYVSGCCSLSPFIFNACASIYGLSCSFPLLQVWESQWEGVAPCTRVSQHKFWVIAFVPLNMKDDASGYQSCKQASLSQALANSGLDTLISRSMRSCQTVLLFTLRMTRPLNSSVR